METLGNDGTVMPRLNRLLVVLPDPLLVYAEKGEIKPRYYNPGQVFNEVHFVSFCETEIDIAAVQTVVGGARMRVHPVGPLSVARLPVVLRRVLAVARSVDPQVIRAYSPSISGLCAVISGRALKCPVVVSVHNDFDHQRRVDPRLKVRLGRFLERYALSRATRVICVTRALVPYVLRHGARDVEVIYNRVDPKQFGGTRREQNEAPWRILSVGRLVPQKDHACLIQAVAGLDDVILTVIGDGPLRPSLETLATRLGVANRVRFIPVVPHSKIQEYYSRADLFAIATRYEGFCIPVLEAMAAGLPVVASDLPPIREILGGAGYLVTHTPEAFRQALITLIADPVEYDRCRQEGLKRAAELDGGEMERREAALYTRILGADDIHKSRRADQPITSMKPLWSDTPQAPMLERGRARHLHRARSTFLVDQVLATRTSAGCPLRILDLGCGDGVITKLLRRAMPFDDWITGLDFDGQRLHRAQMACPDVPLLAADAKALPIDADSLDCIVAHHVVEHVPNDIGILEECYRVLRPKGMCLLGIPQEDSPIGRFLRRCHPRLYRRSEHIHFYSEGSMRDRLESVGFFIDRVAHFGMLFPNYYVHYFLLGLSPAFALGHKLANKWGALADSLIFVARKPEPRS